MVLLNLLLTFFYEWKPSRYPWSISFQPFLTFCLNMLTRCLFGDKHSRTLSIENINFLEKISTKSRNLLFNVLRNVEIVTFAKIKCARNLLICVLVEIRTCTKVTIDIIYSGFFQRLYKYKLNKIKFFSKMTP